MAEQMNQNQNADPAAGHGTGEKTFTQDDVNRIVQERLAKEKAKNSGEADFAKREQELAQRELHMTAKELLSEKGLPVQLFDALNCTDKETLEKSIATIETVFNEYKANATMLSVKLDAPAPCRLDVPDLNFACRAPADCLHQHLQVIWST